MTKNNSILNQLQISKYPEEFKEESLKLIDQFNNASESEKQSLLKMPYFLSSLNCYIRDGILVSYFNE